MSSFETFVNTELPRRPTMLLPALVGGYDGDPNLPGAPAILQNSPTGTYYLQSSGALSIKNSTSPGTWAAVGSGGGGTPDPVAVVRRAQAPFQITVDPVNGNDSPSNDGSVTPLKTLEALCARLPHAHHKGTAYSLNDVASSTTRYVRVLLKAGTHALPADPDGYPLPVDFSNVMIYGETELKVAFVIDSYSDDDMKVHQPAGNSAWVADEHVGKILRLPYLTAFYDYFIIANDSHSLTVAFSGTGYGAYWTPGTAVEIHELKSKIVGPRYFHVTKGNDGKYAGGFYGVEFDASATPNQIFFDQYGGRLAFNSCLVRGGTGTYFAYQEGVAAEIALNGCMFLNCSVGVESYGGYVIVQDVALVNGFIGISGRMHTILDIRGCLVTRNQSYGFWCDRGMDANWIYGGALYCLSTGCIWGFVGGNGALVADGGYLVLAAGKAPDSVFQLNRFGRIVLNYWSIEALIPSNTIQFNPWAGPGGPPVSMSYADFETLYDGYYDWGWDTIVMKGRTST